MLVVAYVPCSAKCFRARPFRKDFACTGLPWRADLWKRPLTLGQKQSTPLTQTSIGALLVLLALACGLLGWLVIKAKNAHLADKDAMREELLKHAIQSRELAAENARAYRAVRGGRSERGSEK